MDKPFRIVTWIASNAPDRYATLTVTPTEGPANQRFCAYWEPGYCGCETCRHIILGYGPTKEAAIADYWQQWEEDTQS